MSRDVVITQEIPSLPKRHHDAHKAQVGRIVVIGGCDGSTTMLGAVALTANAAYRSGAGLVQLVVPQALRHSAVVLAPCATVRSLPADAASLLAIVGDYAADVIAVGPGLGDSMSGATLRELLVGCEVPVVLDADGLNLLATVERFEIPNAARVVMTPHPGEAKRLLAARGADASLDPCAAEFASRRDAALALVELYGCHVILKGHHSIITNGQRLYTNETGNAGMATGGTGDVLTGVVAALIGQDMETLEAAILGTYLHGLAGDFAAEELGRLSMTAMDLIEYLPEAFCDFDVTATE